MVSTFAPTTHQERRVAVHLAYARSYLHLLLAKGVRPEDSSRSFSVYPQYARHHSGRLCLAGASDGVLEDQPRVLTRVRLLMKPCPIRVPASFRWSPHNLPDRIARWTLTAANRIEVEGDERLLWGAEVFTRLGKVGRS
jgi:hypothetical protein